VALRCCLNLNITHEVEEGQVNPSCLLDFRILGCRLRIGSLVSSYFIMKNSTDRHLALQH
ncbi:hypothetical protein, partial [Halomonas sp. FME65]|uniref:hypothetical protein n=1 Tax=Halomonas sp. FME65 TaxID=2742614 RepID=UPI001D0195F5